MQTSEHRDPTGATTVIFDIGNVLLAWDPRYLYRRLIPDDLAREHFLTEVCTMEWITEMDRGVSFSEAVARRAEQFPAYAELLIAYDKQWHETLGGVIEGSVALLGELREAGVPLYALTNFSAEKFAEVRVAHEFFDWFDGLVVSGEEQLVKPDPAFYRVLLDRYGVDPSRAVFIDDRAANVTAARELGMTALQFFEPTQLRADLAALDLPVRPAEALTGEAPAVPAGAPSPESAVPAPAPTGGDDPDADAVGVTSRPG